MKKNITLGLPTDVIYCKKCVISNQKPNSTVEIKNNPKAKKSTQIFDENGVCNACNYSVMRENINWENREKELINLLDEHRKNDGSHDCIVPGSGGKDSCYVSYLLKYKYVMNPLTVTWAPNEFTQIGWENFQSWLNSGFDNILVTPNRDVHRKLTKHSFLNLLHPFQSFIVGQKIAAPKIAIKYKIPLIIYGENPAEYGNNIDDNFNPKMDESYFSTEKSKLNNFYLAGYSKKELINRNILTEKDFNFYKPIDVEEVKENNLEIHYMSYYKKWDPQENYYYAVDNCGFKPAEQRTVGSYSKYSSLDDKIDMFHYYTTCIKFGIGRATYDSSQEVRNGKIDREEAISLVKRFDLEFPERFFSYFLEYTGLNKDEFFNTVDNFRPEHLWYKNGNEWHLKNPVWNNK